MRSMAAVFRSYAVLDAAGKHVGGTDKMSCHNYGDAYEQLFACRQDVQHVLEIGITDGSSMKAWREIFKNALIVGLDKEPCAAARIGGDRLEFHIGDQRSREDCERAANGRQFDLIVDDACHEIDANLATFGYLWPFVRPGGIYVVEECGDAAVFCAKAPEAVLVPTQGPFGGVENLIVVRKLPSAARV